MARCSTDLRTFLARGPRGQRGADSGRRSWFSGCGATALHAAVRWAWGAITSGPQDEAIVLCPELGAAQRHAGLHGDCKLSWAGARSVSQRWIICKRSNVALLN